MPKASILTKLNSNVSTIIQLICNDACQYTFSPGSQQVGDKSIVLERGRILQMSNHLSDKQKTFVDEQYEAKFLGSGLTGYPHIRPWRHRWRRAGHPRYRQRKRQIKSIRLVQRWLLVSNIGHAAAP